MPALITSRVAVTITGTLTKALDLQSASYPLSTAYAKTLTVGTSTDQADLEFDDVGSVPASSFVDIDLSGVLTDPFGATISFVKIKSLYIAALAANVNNLVIGAAAANAWVGPFGSDTDTISLKPGGVLLHSDGVSGWPVTAGTGDLLRIANSGSGTAVTYTIILLGTSA